MARWFRVIDCSRHCGLPVRTACIVFAIITGLLNAYSLYWLPLYAAIPLMITAGVIGLVGILGVITGLRLFTVLYLIFGTLIEIPILVVIGFSSFTIAAYDDQCAVCLAVQNSQYFYCKYSSYQQWLCGLGLGWLWSAEIVCFFALIFGGIALPGFRKLRLFQNGAHSVVQSRGHHSHVQHVHVVHQPQPTVYTVPTQVVQPQPTVIVQQQPAVYPQVPPPVYTPSGVTQPVNYNPPNNPNF